MPFVCENHYIDSPVVAFIFLMKTFNISQAEAQRAVARGRLFCNDETVEKASKEICGAIMFVFFKPVSKGLKPLFEEKEFVLFDKPSGLIMHPQNRHTPYSLVDEVKSQFGIEANITHRLDMETSGLVLCAKNKQCERELKSLFEERQIVKSYLLAIRGHVVDDFSVDAPLKPMPSKDARIRKLMQVSSEGKSAFTAFEVVSYLEDLDITILRALPKTGRMHQIRAHMFHVKHSIVGDPLYGVGGQDVINYLERSMNNDERKAITGASRLLLHAYQLQFVYAGKTYTFESPLDFEALVRASVS